MTEADQIARKIEGLSSLLKKNGKTGPAVFFDTLATKIRNASNPVELKKILLDDVKKSGAIAQYGDFSGEEEALSSEIFGLSEKILGTLSQ